MSSALVRQALALVDPEENAKQKRSKKRAPYQVPTRGQVISYKRTTRKVNQDSKSEGQSAEENIKKLLALSKPTADSAVAEKIVERAIKGKPLADKIEVKVDEEKSILFPEEETFKKFEKEYFCNLAIYKYIPDPQWVLLACALWGLLFIGGLMSFTLYHIYPYL